MDSKVADSCCDLVNNVTETRRNIVQCDWNFAEMTSILQSKTAP